MGINLLAKKDEDSVNLFQKKHCPNPNLGGPSFTLDVWQDKDGTVYFGSVPLTPMEAAELTAKVNTAIFAFLPSNRRPMPTMDEAHRFMESNPKTSEEMLKEIGAKPKLVIGQPVTANGETGRVVEFEKDDRTQGNIRVWRHERGFSSLFALTSVQAIPNTKPFHLTYCDPGCTPEKCSDGHDRRESVCAIDTEVG